MHFFRLPRLQKDCSNGLVVKRRSKRWFLWPADCVPWADIAFGLLQSPVAILKVHSDTFFSRPDLVKSCMRSAVVRRGGGDSKNTLLSQVLQRGWGQKKKKKPPL